MEERYTYHNGEWCYSNGNVKKMVIDCNKCQIKDNLNEIEKYECNICEKLKNKTKI